MLIAEGYNVVGVVTQPDKPQRPQKVLTPTPVKAAAEAPWTAGISTGEALRDPESVIRLAEWKPDLIVTAAFGQILPEGRVGYACSRLCECARFSFAKYRRGGTQFSAPLLMGSPVTGATLMYHGRRFGYRGHDLSCAKFQSPMRILLAPCL